MNNYLARAWVEISLGLLAYRMKAGESTLAACADYQRLLDGLRQSRSFTFAARLSARTWMRFCISLASRSVSVPRGALYLTTEHPPYPNDSETFLHVLGASKYDTPSTIEDAYDLQISEDYANCPIYLSALTCLSHVLVPGHEVLQIKVATEKSLDRYTTGGSSRTCAR